jgi:hypothetical protein
MTAAAATSSRQDMDQGYLVIVADLMASLQLLAQLQCLGMRYTAASRTSLASAAVTVTQ